MKPETETDRQEADSLQAVVSRVHSSISYTKLEIKGTFGITGPQTVGGPGCAPQWAADALANPKIIAVAYVTENGGAVYQRIAANKA